MPLDDIIAANLLVPIDGQIDVITARRLFRNRLRAHLAAVVDQDRGNAVGARQISFAGLLDAGFSDDAVFVIAGSGAGFF